MQIKTTFSNDTKTFFKEVFTSIDIEPINDNRFRAIAAVRLIFIFPAIFAFTLFSFISLVDLGYHPRAQGTVLITWSTLASLYIISNLIIYFAQGSKVKLKRFLTCLSLFIELGTNQLVLYYYGSLISHATLYIVVVVAVYRVFFDYRSSLFAAIAGSLMYTAVAVLEVTGFLPLSPGFPSPASHPVYLMPETFGFQKVIQAVLIGIFITFASTNYGMNQAVKLQKLLREQSLIDSLTGLANRRSFEEFAGTEWDRARRSLKPLSLIMIDIDYFKEYNDTHGHLAGDSCLKSVAQSLSKTLNRPADKAARYGGEEFIVLLPETPLEGAARIAEELRLNIEALDLAPAYSLSCSKITLSLGVAAAVPGKNQTYRNLVERADRALYRAKQRGRNRVETDTESI